MALLHVYPRSSIAKPPLRTVAEAAYGAAVARVVIGERLDLIHAHFAYIGGAVGLLAKTITGRPLIVSVHGYDIIVRDKQVRYGVRRSPPFDALVRQVLEEADAVVAASRFMVQETSKLLGSKEKITLIPNGVDLRRFSTPGESGTHHSGRKVVFTLRPHKPKYGLDYLIRAIPRVVQHYPESYFVIGGDGPLRPRLEELAVRLRVHRRVEFTGTIPGRSLPEYYKSCDLVVVPSIVEAFGLAVTEAMACGRPVVASRVGGIVEQVIDGYNGYLVPPADPEKLADAIIRVLSDESLARRMGVNGRLLAEQRFDLRAKAVKLRDLYLRFIGEPTSGEPRWRSHYG